MTRTPDADRPAIMIAGAGRWLALGDLGEHETEVIEMIVARARMGRRDYGPLDPSRDRRDLLLEALEEHIDALFYLAADACRLRALIGRDR